MIIVASVSCIYGLGSPEDYKAMMVGLRRGEAIDRDAMLRKLVDIQYERNDIEFAARQVSRARRLRRALAVVRGIRLSDRVLGRRGRAAFDHQSDQRRSDRQAGADCSSIRPSTSCMPEERIASGGRRRFAQELDERLELFKSQGKLLEAQRLSARTRFDIEMMLEMGYCPGIENYSRPLSGPAAGLEPPYTLFDFFPNDYLLIVDESHATVPQVRAMFAGDQQPQDDAGRARLSPAERARQSAAASSTNGEQRINQVVLRFGHAGAVRTGADRRRSRRAGRFGRPGCSIR